MPSIRRKGWVCAGRCAGPAAIPPLRGAFAADRADAAAGRGLPEQWEGNDPERSRAMELRIVDPRKLKSNPNNPR
nr:hypothetical protein [Rhodospirillales bacterium]